MDLVKVYFVLALAGAILLVLATVNAQIPKRKPWNLTALGLLAFAVIVLVALAQNL